MYAELNGLSDEWFLGAEECLSGRRLGGWTRSVRYPNIVEWSQRGRHLPIASNKGGSASCRWLDGVVVHPHMGGM